MANDYVLYLQVGDRVYHKKYRRWGIGVVIEERRSELPGGFCYVRVDFQDGKVRIFDNNFNSHNCCYYSGIEKIEFDEDCPPKRVRGKKNEKKSIPKLKK
ncbi:MAG: DUF3553 domain-containing protein [Desulfobacterota bacterium]|nr:DUF3553 domain-containing protein [Thermodesulfobacteriota bacterium]MDW8002250.1 DUF3553 domain-containing protein [Deltaproteobacteria bacterium]